MKQEIIKQIIAAGIAAPSADNSQPWLYKYQNNRIELHIDKTRSGKLSDSRFLLSDIAIGCVAENMLIQAKHLGLKGTLTFFPEGEKNTPLYPLSIDFSPTSKKDDITQNSIYERHTDRSFPWRKPLTESQRHDITQSISAISDTTLIWPTKSLRKKTLKALFIAESLRFSDQDFHQELFSSIDFNLDWKQNSIEQLAPASLNVERIAQPIFKACRNWKFMKFMNLIGGSAMFGFRSALLPNLLSADLCILSTQTTNRPGIVNLGRALQRVWLTATSNQINLHPFASVGVMSLNFFNKNNPEIGKIQELLQTTTLSERGIILLRLGASSRKSQQMSKRRPDQTFLLAKQAPE